MEKEERLYVLKQLRDKEFQHDETKLDRFIPNLTQQPVLDAFLNPKKRVIAFIAANKIGKSTIGVKILWEAVKVGGVVARVVGSLGFEKGIKDVIYPEIKKWFPAHRILREKPNSQGVIVKMYIQGDNGKESIISFMSGDQDPMTFEGDMTDFVWIDEPCKKSIYTASLRSLMISSGKMLITLTPLSEFWIYNDIYLSQDPEIICLQGNMWDAHVDKGGHLTTKQIESIIAKYPEDEIQARVFGQFKHLIGRVFKAFDLNKHVIKNFKIPEHWPVYCAIDPHTRKPNAAVWLAVSPEDEWYICNEVYWGAGIDDFGKEILRVSNQYRTVCHVIDTSSETPDWKRKETARGILRKVGVDTTLARKKNNKESARMIIQQALEGKDETGKPWLFCFESCQRTKHEFLNYVWDNYKNPESQGIKEEPKKINDDILDCLHYIVIERPRYHKPREISVYEGARGGRELFESTGQVG